MWQVLLLGLALASGGGVPSQPADPCGGKLGAAFGSCMEEKVSASRALLAKYLEASRRIVAERPADLKAVDTSQRLWESFVEADCAAASEHFSGGSVRSLQAVECRLAHEEERRYWLWSRYLAGTIEDLGEPRRACER